MYQLIPLASGSAKLPPLQERTDGAADGAPAAEPEQEEAESQGHGNGPDESSLTACLASFFAPEQVEWECPSKEEDSGSDPAFKTPLRDNQALMSRNVSFSGEASCVQSTDILGSKVLNLSLDNSILSSWFQRLGRTAG